MRSLLIIDPRYSVRVKEIRDSMRLAFENQEEELVSELRYELYGMGYEAAQDMIIDYNELHSKFSKIKRVRTKKEEKYKLLRQIFDLSREYIRHMKALDALLVD